MDILQFGLIVLLGGCIVGITMTIRHWAIEMATGRSAEMLLESCLHRVVFSLIVGDVICFFGGSMLVGTRYADTILFDLLGYALFIIWFVGIASGALLADIDIRFSRRPLLRIAWYGFVFGCWLFFGWLGADTPSMLAQKAHMLIQGPRRDHGVVKQTFTTGGRSPTYTAIIDTNRYFVLDSGWFRTLSPGKPIDFLHDPYRTLAFPPTQAGFGPWSVLASGCGVALVLLTIFGAFQGIRQIISAFRKGDAPSKRVAPD